MIIGLSIGSILLLLILAIIIATIIYLKRRQIKLDKKHSINSMFCNISRLINSFFFDFSGKNLQ